MTTTAAVPDARKPIRWLDFLAAFRAWLFLGILLITFEIWAHVEYDSSFFLKSVQRQIDRGFHRYSALVRLSARLSSSFRAGLILSVGFTMGLSAVVTAHVFNWGNQFGNPVLSLVLAVSCRLRDSRGARGDQWVAHCRSSGPSFHRDARDVRRCPRSGLFLSPGHHSSCPERAVGCDRKRRNRGIPNLVLLTIVILLVIHYLLSQTRYGQHIYAIGGNVNAALRAGINVRNNTIALYILSSLTAGCAGILYTAKFSAGAAQAGEPVLLDSIAAVVIGGASLFGGSGTVIGTMIGALIIAVIQYGLVFVDVEPFWQFVAVGVVIIISVLVDQIQKQVGKDGRMDSDAGSSTTAGGR